MGGYVSLPHPEPPIDRLWGVVCGGDDTEEVLDVAHLTIRLFEHWKRDRIPRDSAAVGQRMAEALERLGVQNVQWDVTTHWRVSFDSPRFGRMNVDAQGEAALWCVDVYEEVGFLALAGTDWDADAKWKGYRAWSAPRYRTSPARRGDILTTNTPALVGDHAPE